MPDFAFEEQAWRRGATPVAGVDEAGRGPWAGPVFAAAVAFGRRALPEELIGRLDDSKLLSRAWRERLYPLILSHAQIGVGQASVVEIDRLNILAATMLAMRRAVAALASAPRLALVDGNAAPELDCEVRTVVGGDGRSFSIAAASVVAKVTRDRHMATLAARHPGYGWERNAGYGTPEHRAALRHLGVSAEHRHSFRPISELLAVMN